MLKRLFKPLASLEDFYATEKPTTTLAKMIALTLIEEMPAFEQSDKYHISGYETTKFFIAGRDVYYDNHPETNVKFFPGNRQHWTISSFKFIHPPGYTGAKLSGLNPVAFSFEESSMVAKALKKIGDLRKKKAEADAVSDNQHKAVDILAAWVKVPEVQEGEEG